MSVCLISNIIYRSRTMKRVGDESRILNDFNELYKSYDESEQLWAIDQIPLTGIKGNHQSVLQCFQYFCENLNLEEVDIINALHAAISRELLSPVLTPDERYNYVLPITIECINANMNGKWIHLLHRICRMIKNTIQQSIGFEKAQELIEEGSYFSRICASHIIAGLCEAGATIPNALISTLLEHIHVFEMCYSPVIWSLMECQSDNYLNNVLDQIIVILPSEVKLLRACFMLPRIPERLLQWMRRVLEFPNLSTESVCVVAKNRNKILDLGILSESQIIQMIWSSSIFTPLYFEVIAEYYQKTVPCMKETDALSFLKRICSSESPFSVQLTALFLKFAKNKQSISFAINYLCQPRAFVHFNDWIKSFDFVVNNVTGDHANALTQALIQFTLNEINVGHILNKDGTKVIGEIDMKKIKKEQTKAPIAFVKGWREISQMIEALSHSPAKWILRGSGIKVLKNALEVHTNPLIPSIVSYLYSIIASPEAIFEFFDYLLKGGSNKQIVLIKIIPQIMKSLNYKDVIEKIGIPIANLINHNSPVNVKCAALKLLPEFMIYNSAFVNSPLIKICLKAFYKIENSSEPYVKEIIDSIACDYKRMEHLLPKGKENMDCNTISDNYVKPISRNHITRKRPSLGIKKSTVLKPVAIPRTLPPI
ncbi:hypothetical protein TRFO_15444 [Tritrichomonas foetus]|uniref:HEAT repeat family protein n=1 Tax=Tritrichomonas foetus TaxID=1144522 RepID=A0A1J4KSK9_9EUKA|nr:hypothetical protein TRFO_15444 [Tritrichomonas foetus]|eukprot:OHT14271.1 hypothetical protein TRFO_15444 [Tritrichomonas foetus]